VVNVDSDNFVPTQGGKLKADHVARDSCFSVISLVKKWIPRKSLGHYKKIVIKPLKNIVLIM